jgi:hypothetical protein
LKVRSTESEVTVTAAVHDGCSLYVPDQVLVSAAQPVTLVIDGGQMPGSGTIAIEPGVKAVPMPLPINEFACSGG